MVNRFVDCESTRFDILDEFEFGGARERDEGRQHRQQANTTGQHLPARVLLFPEVVGGGGELDGS